MATQWQINLLDLQGKSLYHTQVFSEAGINETLLIDAEALPLSSGAYILQFQNGQEVFQTKLLYLP